MKGPVNFEIETKRIKYCITLFHNVSMIIGDGGTGKSTIRKFMEFLRDDKDDYVDIKCNIPYEVTREFEFRKYGVNLFEEGKLYILDENLGFTRTKEFFKRVFETGSFFLIINRSLKIASQPIDVNAVYNISTSKNNGIYVNTLRHAFDKEMSQPRNKGKVFTEDKKSGYLLCKHFGYDVDSLNGNGGIKNLLLNKEGVKMNLFVDTVAFAHFIPLIRRESKNNEIFISALKSVEHLYLQNKAFSDIQDKLVYQNCTCDFLKYKSLERYYTDLLTSLSKERTGSNYSKSKLMTHLIDDNVRRKLFELLGEPESHEETSMSKALKDLL